MEKPTGGAMSNDKTAASETQTETQTANATQALTVSETGDVSGPVQLALSTETQDRLLQEFQSAMHQVQEGFGDLAKPTDIYAQGLPFTVIDAVTIDDFEDKRKGEILVKHIFKLEFEDGRTMLTMQSDARPRRELAKLFTRARALGARVKAGPYKYEMKDVNQPQPAFIFAQQPGFQVLAY